MVAIGLSLVAAVCAASVPAAPTAPESVVLDESEQAFWQQPSWEGMEAYVQSLIDARALSGAQGWPRDEALERMKAHLAQGVMGSPPQPLHDWETLKQAAEDDIVLGSELQALQRAGQPVPEALAQAYYAGQTRINTIQNALQLYSPLHDNYSDDGITRLIGLLRAIELPAVRKSWFKDESSIAPPGDAESMSGRFNIPLRWQVEPRPLPEIDEDFAYTPGLYDMLSRRQELLRPVQKVRLFSDGRLHRELSSAVREEILWREVDPPMCDGWLPGFSYGDAEGPIWDYFGGPETTERERSGKARGSLYELYVTNRLPRAKAQLRRSEQLMDRELTGFVSSTQWEFDLDADGVADLLVWQGTGQGPGHLDEILTTDDAWYRLVLANIDGRWKVLGSDRFGYGCGC